MTLTEPSLFPELEKRSSVRHTDPLTAKAAAAAHQVERQRQWKAILRRLHEGPVSADTAGVVIGRHRSIASSRLGVMERRGLVEKAGLHSEPPADGGLPRLVLRYRLTRAGEAEYLAMFGGGS